jgi:NitT/TauT family transport system permease protein
MSGRKAIIGTASTLALLLAWEAVSRGGLVSERFLPAPSTVLATLWTMIFERDLLYHAGVSTLRVWTAFLIAAAMAVPIGILMGSFRWVGAALEPIVDFIRYLPVPALVPCRSSGSGWGRGRRSSFSGSGPSSSLSCSWPTTCAACRRNTTRRR